MNRNIKIIILGFALMLLGGFIYIAGSASKVDLPRIQITLINSLYIGFILIIAGLVIPPKK
ncbi:hypothetical protein SAMN02745136_00387 [Anaerocolumna jejuensis DSM 15929]|uniref:Uncharacterized protein n=1 Tax=Anaerocolumna jejuensis DSM 15929 TaxID=1121322 RepID=A0A1M6KB43_9FIRM|nr:hypothetical protein SAMN02745136_00387 [Anaerocolumna jejuensis DSM 15929]